MQNATVTIFGYTFEHIALAEPFGNPAYVYRVTTEDGYFIHTSKMPENMYKTVTFLYATDDLSTVEIVAAADLPADAEINNVEDKPEVM
jgi:hypothetical protein